MFGNLALCKFAAGSIVATALRFQTHEQYQDNEIMFVGKDVATALGYSNTRDALNKHVDPEDKGTVAFRDTAYETRAVVINESGLYSLILSSKLPQAKAFNMRVFDFNAILRDMGIKYKQSSQSLVNSH